MNSTYYVVEQQTSSDYWVKFCQPLNEVSAFEYFEHVTQKAPELRWRIVKVVRTETQEVVKESGEVTK